MRGSNMSIIIATVFHTSASFQEGCYKADENDVKDNLICL